LGDLVKLLESPDARVQRSAAEALGRLGDSRAIESILRAAARANSRHEPAANAPERVMEHSIIYALIEINSPLETRQGLKSQSPAETRAALVALDQMDRGDLKPEEVTRFLDPSRAALLNHTANWIISHRREWAGPVASHLEAELLNLNGSAVPERSDLPDRLQKLASAPAMQSMLAAVAGRESAPRTARVVALDALRQARVKELSDLSFLITLLRSDDAELVPRAAATAAAVSFKNSDVSVLKSELARVVNSHGLPAAARLEALQALAGKEPLDAESFKLVRANLSPETAPSLRGTATAILSRAKLTDQQAIEVPADLRTSTPLDIGKLVDLYEKHSSAEVGSALVASLKDARGLAGVHAGQLKQVLSKYPDSVREQGRDLLASLNQDAEKQAAFIDELLPRVQNGSVPRGQAIFNSTRAACASCHAIGYLGGNVGPDLTRIGQIRNERDLLEAIIYPSASFVRSYEPFLVSTKDGEDFSGILRKDASDEVILATGPGLEVRIPRGEITAFRPGQVSTMPQGLNEQLSEQELADLLAFLKATRW
jgi:putative heme-binding domain-containing protein